MANRIERQVAEILEAADRTSPIAKAENQKMKKLTVAFLGPVFSHSHEAALAMFPQAEHLSCETFRSIFEYIFDVKANVGVVPVQNSISGSVFEPYHELFQWADRGLEVSAEYFMRIQNFLVASEEIPLASLEKIYTKDEAHKQCVDWLTQHGLNNLVEHVGSTSRAAEIVEEAHGKTVAAICSESAARAHNLFFLSRRPITDDPTNMTRFLTIQRTQSRRFSSKRSVTMLFVVFHDSPGALHSLLEIFARHRINLRDLVKGPLRHSISVQLKDWWCLEFSCSRSAPEFQEAYRALLSKRALAPVVKLAGCFPQQPPRRM